MGKNRDIESISNSLANTILHELLIEHTNKPESINHLESEEIEYRSQAIKKIEKRNLNIQDREKIKEKIIAKIKNMLESRYSDIQISKEKVEKRVAEELRLFFK